MTTKETPARKRPDNRRPLLYVLFRKFGLRGTLQILREDVLFDLVNRTNTAVPVSQKGLYPRIDHAEQNRYVVSTFGVLNQVFIHMRTLMDFTSVGFVDLGSGKGKALVAASEQGFRSIRGIEVSRRMVATCRRNLDRLNLAESVDVVEQSAADFIPQPHERLFYLFNPFTGHTLARCIDQIAQAEREGPGYLAYVNPTEQAILDEVLIPLHTCFLQPGNCEVRYYRLP